jgi:chromosome segregation ATPase
LEDARRQEGGLNAQLEALRRRLDELQREAASRSTGSDGISEQAELLRAERDALSRRLADTEQRMAGMLQHLSQTEGQLEEAQKQLTQRPASTGDEQSGEDDRRRYAMVMDDLRELENRNAELQKELARARAGGGHTARGSSGLDWEAEKRRILAALEADHEDDDEQRAEERIQIGQVLERTQQAVEEKECEIRELRTLLENQSSNLGSVAVGAAALGEIFDKDALIQEERANLRRLQTECDAKLRKAEIDISIERAKLARERAELEERLRAQSHKSSQPSPPEPNAPGASDKPTRGRWFARLGLTDNEP